MTPQEQEAFARGRLQGLREMDEAHGKVDLAADVKDKTGFSEGMDALDKLRQEYQQQN